MSKELGLPLPRDWPRLVKRALLAAVGLERQALLAARSGFEHSPDPRARLCAAHDGACEDCALWRETARILQARMAQLPPAQRPHYPPVERHAILNVRSKRSWSAAETARQFQVTAETIAHWMQRLEEEGPEALVQLAEPVTKYDDAVTALVQRLHEAAPHQGRRKLTEFLLSAGMQLAASTVGRMLKRKPVAPAPPPPPAPEPQAAEEPQPKPAVEPAPEPAKEDKPVRVVTASRPHHVWHVDITAIPIGLPGTGFWVPWWPFAVVMRWLLSWHLVLVLDHYTRMLVAFRILRREPTAEQVCGLLDEAAGCVGTAPKYIVSDQGSQFQSDYRAWCKKRGVRPRFGAVGQHGSIAIIERFILSLKEEFLRRIHVPASLDAMTRAMAAYQLWYNEHRPHAALEGRTPKEMLEGAAPPRERVRIEPRARMPLPAAAGAGPPLVRRPRGNIEPVVAHVDAWRELPVVQLREAA